MNIEGNDILKQAVSRIAQLEETIIKQAVALDKLQAENADLKIKNSILKKEGEKHVNKQNDSTHRQK